MSIPTHIHHHFVTELPSEKITDAVPPLPPIEDDDLPSFLEEMIDLSEGLGQLMQYQRKE